MNNKPNNMPGFTGEASLHKTNGHYYTADTLNTLAGERGVLPQLRRFGLSPDYVGCLGGCAQWCQVTEVEGELPCLHHSEESPIYWVVTLNVIDIATCSTVGKGVILFDQEQRLIRIRLALEDTAKRVNILTSPYFERWS